MKFSIEFLLQFVPFVPGGGHFAEVYLCSCRPAVSPNPLATTFIKAARQMSKVAVIKTKPTSLSVDDFINSMADEQKRKDSYVILQMMEKATKEKPKMWGSSMIGFGEVRYKSPGTGREVDWFKIGFSPRKANFSLHLISLEPHADALSKLGKHKTGLGCLYINKLSDVDVNVLEKMIVVAAAYKFG